MRIVIALLLLALLGGATPASAASRPPLVAPNITVQNVEASSSTTPQRFRVTLLIDNVNTEPLAIKTLEFKLRLANEGIIDGAVPPLTVEALDREQLTLELSSDIVSSLSRLLAFVQGPANTLPYEIYGRVTLSRGWKRDLPFSVKGEVPLAVTSER
jgi:hypothetical protein